MKTLVFLDISRTALMPATTAPRSSTFSPLAALGDPDEARPYLERGELVPVPPSLPRMLPEDKPANVMSWHPLFHTLQSPCLRV